MKSWEAVGTIGVLGALLATPAAHAAPLPGFELAGESAHFAFYSRPGSRSSVEATSTERKIARIADSLGVSDVPRSDFYCYESAGDVAAVTGLYAGGVTYPALGQIHSTDGARDHEIVHRVAFLLGNPGPFFQEGLAVALGDAGKWQGKSVDRVAKDLTRGATLPALIAGFDSSDPRMGYAVAGSFMRWLIKRHGLARVATFFRECHNGPAAAAFDTVFGIDLARAGATWVSEL